MNLDRVTAGRNPPAEVNVVVEIPIHGPPVKYELDKESGAMFVDRFLNTSIEELHYQGLALAGLCLERLRRGGAHHPPYQAGRS